MYVKNLGQTDFDTVINCFLKAFTHYYVEIPVDKDFYRQRWKNAKVNFNLSYGMFDEDNLVAFVLNAVDKRQSILTAFNTGTGVLPAYRGQKLVKTIYKYAFPELIRNKVKKCSLEVITQNLAAIKAYQSCGFEICKNYKCFKGIINLNNKTSITLKEYAYKDFDWKNLPNQAYYSWDNQSENLRGGNYQYFKVLNNNEPQAFFVINAKTGYLAQFDLLEQSSHDSWEYLFTGITSISEMIRINNVDVRLEDKVKYLNLIGLDNHIDQYEMELKLSG